MAEDGDGSCGTGLGPPRPAAGLSWEHRADAVVSVMSFPSSRQVEIYQKSFLSCAVKVTAGIWQGAKCAYEEKKVPELTERINSGRTYIKKKKCIQSNA